MAKLAIRGHVTRGSEVIELLEMLTADRLGYKDTFVGFYYYIECGAIVSSDECPIDAIVFTLEEFEEKFPYKVGDKVIYEDKRREITKMVWEEQTNTIAYKLDDKLYCNVINDLQPYKESKCLQELKEYLDNATSEQLEEDWKELEKFSEFGPVADEYIKQWEEFVKPYEEENMEERKYADLRLDVDQDDKLATEVTIDGNKITPPENYLIGKITKVDNGMLVEFVKKQPQYPKNYEECCKVLGINSGNFLSIRSLCYADGEEVTTNYEQDLRDIFDSLWELRICRDAYWKIYGEYMGLEKLWEPDWDNLSTTHEFIKINKGCFTYSSRVLVFPTEEMRDAFYDNFKDLIEDCKELL